MVKFWRVLLQTWGLFMLPCFTTVDATQEVTKTAKMTIFTMTIISQGSSLSFHMFRRSISRPVYQLRPLSTAAPSQARVSFPIDRIPLLEELFEVPVLRTSEMRAESLAEVKGFVPPVLPSHLETCLSAEFERPILETDWGRYEDVTTSYEQAARLIHHTLAIYSNVGKSALQKPEEIKALISNNQEWIKKECHLMLKEVEDGDYSRWEAANKLLGDMDGKLSEAQLKAVKPALAIIARNAWLHPKTKAQVVAEICRVVSATIKQ